jgi:hypothetical protein
MEYAGSGTNYNALPENGGVADESKEAINLNSGKVWLTSTDQSGKFKVGDTFAVDQQTGFVTIDPQSVATNVVSDLSPELGGDLDVLTRNIYSSVGPIKFNTSSTERARIDSSGRLLVGTTTANTSGAKLQTVDGLTFPATQVASSDPNTLDDYEEGTFTLTVTANSVASGGNPRTFASQRYVKIGQIVWFTVTFDTGGWVSATNPITFTGLPFTAAEGAAVSVGRILYYSFTDPLPLTAYVDGTSILVRRTQASASGSSAFETDDNGFDMIVSGVYRVS